MTVQELIDELLKIEDKSRNVKDKWGDPVEIVWEATYTHSVCLYDEFNY